MPYSENLRRLSELILGKIDAEVVEYKGGTVGYGLYSGEDVAIQRAFLPAGTTLALHAHKVVEIVVGISGSMKIEIGGGNSIEIAQGDVVKIPANTPHYCAAVEDTWVIGMLIPHNGGYPNAK